MSLAAYREAIALYGPVDGPTMYNARAIGAHPSAVCGTAAQQQAAHMVNVSCADVGRVLDGVRLSRGTIRRMAEQRRYWSNDLLMNTPAEVRAEIERIRARGEGSPR